MTTKFQSKLKSINKNKLTGRGLAALETIMEESVYAGGNDPQDNCSAFEAAHWN